MTTYADIDALIQEFPDKENPTRPELLKIADMLVEIGDLKGAQDLRIMIARKFEKGELK
jgi:hypothetical protein